MSRRLPILSVSFVLFLVLLAQTATAQRENKIIRRSDSLGTWNTSTTNNVWQYEDKGDPLPVDTYFFRNDAVVFDDYVTRPETTAINVQGDIYISQQTGYLTDAYQQQIVQELGMRVSGKYNWTFNGGTISDDFHPDSGAAAKTHVGRITFDGTGVLTLRNVGANEFHDGFLVGSTGIDTGGAKLPPSVVNVARPDSLGSGEYAGEWANVQYPYDYETNPRLKKYIVQKEGYGIMFTGNGAVINIAGTNPSRGMDNRIFVQNSSSGSILMTQSNTETAVTVSDSYWKNNANFGVYDPNNGNLITAAPIQRGGVVVAEDNSTFNMTGNFHFKNNLILKKIDDQQHTNNVNTNYSVTDTGVDADTFFGGVLFAGQSVNVDMTGASFTNNGKFAAKTVDTGGSVTYTHLTDAADAERIVSVARGGAVYFTGGEVIDPNTGGINYATLTVSASSANSRTQIADNAAQVGGAIYIADGTGGTLNAENIDFSKNRAYYGSGGALYIQNSQQSEKRMQVKLTNSQFVNNIAFDSADPGVGGAIVIQSDADVDLSNAVFRYNGVLTSTRLLDPTDPASAEEYINNFKTDTRTFAGGAIAAGENVHLRADNAIFEENAALSDGGAVYINGGSLNVSAGRFENNHSINGRGGAVFIESLKTPEDADTVPVMNAEASNFISNDALLHGGAVYLAQGGVQLNITRAYFGNNATHSNNSLGGAIYAGVAGVTIVGTESRFEYNMYGNPGERDNGAATANSEWGKGLQGGAVYIGDYGTLYLNRAIFSQNRTTSVSTDNKGGAIYTGIGTYVNLTDAALMNNWAYNNGGAVYTVGGENEGETGTLIIDNATFRQNGVSATSTGRSTRYGGAVFAGLTRIQGNQAVFSQNEAFGNGGALYINSLNKETAAVELNDAAFDRNKVANGSGGAVYINATGGTDPVSGESYNVTFNANGAKFLSNEAKQNGGAIYGTSRTTINVNTSASGSAVFGTYDAAATPAVGNIAGQHGGAIYLDGGEGDQKSTSQLNAQGAIFGYNSAGANGGAVYLRYADADISQAQFSQNTAEGFGGGLYYENENGRELSVETATFTANKAVSGGAIHTVNEAVIHAKGTLFLQNEAVTGSGGAINFEADNSQLDITGAEFRFNTADGDGGAVRLNKNSKIIATNANFFNNTARNGGGAAVKIGGSGQIQGFGSQFDGNVAAGPGGAVWLDGTADGQNVLNIDGSRFTDNQSLTGGGGAVYAGYAEISATNSTFSGNTAGGINGQAVNGGGVFVLNSDLNITGTMFTGNRATGKGGAVYYQTTDGIGRVINLGTSTAQNSIFSGNFSDGKANSIYFDSSVQTDIRLDVNTGVNGRLDMQDPLIVDETNYFINLDMVKTGSGKWTLGGVNHLGHTSVGTMLEVKEGTFELANGAELNLRNEDESDYIKVVTGAGFAGGGPKDANSSIVRVTNLDFAVNSDLKLDGNLTLNVANDYTIGSVISGNGGLIKEDFKNPDGTYNETTLEFRGATKNFNGDIAVRSGNLVIVKDNNVEGSGRIVTENGTFFMAPDTDLYLNADPKNPTIVAKSANINDSHIHIGGITESYIDQFILIHTADGISGEFKSADGGAKGLQSVDYLTYNFGFLNDHKDYGGTIGLRWYSNDDTLKAWGKFTLADKDDYFNVGVVLYDNNVNLYPADPSQPGYDPNWNTAWDGKTLDKFGQGTLELSQTNTYTGKTSVHAGELYVTNAQGTGLGSAVVEVQKDARLGLNFNGNYSKTIAGGGQVVIKGGKVELSGKNTYSNGTVLKDGVLEFSTQDNLGTGTLTFDGGTLRNLQETVITLPVTVMKNRDAVFDVPKYEGNISLTVDGIISGEGGLKKRGNGTLALTAENTFAGTSYAEQGGLKIDGSVVGDVRVERDAAVAGNNGHIGRNLFINKGGYYDWYFTPDRAASGPLNVAGNVFLGDAIFRPRTHSADFQEHITGWTVMTYGGNLNREFAAIDNSFNAFYNFTLDYSTNGEIRIDGELLSRPNPLSDIVTTGLSIANRKLYRNVFAQLMRETVYCKTSEKDPDSAYRGQSQRSSRSAWFTPTARANHFESTFVGGDYSLETYGMQTGTTFWENQHSSLGLMLGYERGSLRNRLDWIRSHDYYLGLYYGYLFGDGLEFRTFLGGGIQTFTLARNDLEYIHKSTYDGSSFEWNAEFGKLFAGQNGTIFRPYIAGDIETSNISAAQEKQIDSEDITFRHYGRATLPQFFVRFGADVEKRFQYVDINGGLSYTGLLLGRTHARSPIYYPVRGAGTVARGARLGRSTLTFKTGVNWNLNRQRTSSVFLDYFADVYMDRAGDTAQHTGSVGISVRF